MDCADHDDCSSFNKYWLLFIGEFQTVIHSLEIQPIAAMWCKASKINLLLVTGLLQFLGTDDSGAGTHRELVENLLFYTSFGR